ncbi:MAG: response regulator, partial [Patescibacteria group bacterium]
MKKILLVEDDKFTSDIYVQILSGEFKVDTAEDGESAYKIITGTEYDLILLDMYLPIMDGKKLFEKLENDFPGKYKKKIVFIT